MTRSPAPIPCALLGLVTMLTVFSGAGLAAEPPEPALPWQAGDVFEYQNSGEAADPSAAGMMPKAIRQTVRVADEEPCAGDGTCWRLEATQTLAPLILPTGKAAEAENTSSSRALVNVATGDLVEIERTIRIMGQESTSTTAVKSRNSIFADFYGPWMLDLENGYQEAYELSRGVRTYEVTGRERVGSRDCFVVLRVTPTPDGGFTKTTFWVDVAERIAVRVREGSWNFELVSKAQRP